MADGCAGARGTLYEFRFCMLCVVRGYTRELTNFKLRYQVPESEVGKFDDVVFDEGEGIYQVFQLKHKEKEGKYKISSSHLFNEKFSAELNLLKYVNSYFSALRSKVDIAVVLTNIDFDFEKLNSIELHPFTLNGNAIFDTSNLLPNAKCYKFDNDPNIVHQLKRQAVKVSKVLREKLKKTPKPSKKDDDEKNIKYENQQKDLRENDEALANFLENLKEDDIQEALQHIVYAVRQPNDTELEEIIKNEIQSYFKLQNADTVYNTLEKAITEWCNKKEPFIYEVPTSNPHVIYFRDAEIFFQKNVKNVSFGTNVPTSSFTGRKHELNLIRKKLEEKHDLVVSQSLTINGLGGIGKTQLTKQFIKEFGQPDFYGRVIWIEAESDESVEKSFKELAEKINIQDRESISTTILIDQIFDYFHGFKVLFVFDNFDQSLASAEETHDVVKPSNDKPKNFVTYCREIACDSTKNHRPYFIFTSRNRDCLPGVSSFDLSVLTMEDAKKLIKNGLIVQNYTDEDVDKLAEVLQYFPLALQQAIAYVNKQQKVEGVSGGEYVIQNYLKEFAEKKKELLNYRCENDFGEHERTTLVTWNVTLDAIRQDETNGPNAIKVLQLMSYLYADEIDAKMFLSIFEDDSTRNGEAFILLEKYSLITKIRESTFYQIHRLVQAVVQLRFKEQENAILEQAWKLIYPKLHENYFYENKFLIYKLIEQCTFSQFLHYKSLGTYIKNYEFMRLFGYLHDRILIAACLQGNIDKIIKLQFSQKALKEYASTHSYKMFYSNSTKVIIYFLENGYIELSDEEILQITLRVRNFDIFKYLVEKGVNLKELSLESEGLVYDIMQGKLDSLLSIIKKRKTERNVNVLRESLFFATLFNQESIVELLIANEVEPDFNLFGRINYAPIIAAAKLKYPNILRILLTAFNKRKFKDTVGKILFDLLREKHFCDKNCFEIIFKKYLELGGDINNQHDYYGLLISKSTFLCYVTWTFNVIKIEIINFLLDNDADPCVFDKKGRNALFYVLRIMHDENSANKSSLYDIYSKMRSKISTEKFMTTICDLLCTLIQCKDADKIFHVLLKNIDNKNLRNDKGETLLIQFVRNLTNNFEALSTGELIVQSMLKAGVDVDAKDNNGKDVLYYAFDVESHHIFKLLLTKVSSVSEEILIKAIKEEKLLHLAGLFEAHFNELHIFADGKTILEVALENVSLETILFLHPKFKKINFQKENVERIAEQAKMALLQYIKTRPSSESYVNLNIIDIFFELGADDVNACDNDENNSLHYATDLKDDETFKYLLSKGGKVHEKTLEHAIKHDKVQIVQAIIPKYFKKKHRFADGLTPITLAANSKAEKVQKFLTELSSRRTCSII